MSWVQRFCLWNWWQNTTSLSWLQTASPDYARLCSLTARLLKVPSLPVLAPRHRRSSRGSLAPSLHQEVVEHLQSNSFSIAIDGKQWQELWQVLSHPSAVLHRPVTNQLPCHACLQHWHYIKHLQPFAASVPGQQHPMIKPGFLYVRQLQCYDWQTTQW